jgi:Sulfatase
VSSEKLPREPILRLWLQTSLRLASGTYFILTSVYCLLAFLPYTFCALIKAPPYAWMPWFVQHQGLLYWSALSAAMIANWKPRTPGNDKRAAFGFSALAIAGAYVTLRPFLPTLKSDSAAYWWSLAALAMQTTLALWQLLQSASSRHNPANAQEKNRLAQREGSFGPFSLPSALLVALVISLIYTVAAWMRIFSHSGAPALSFQMSDVTLAAWSLVSHFALAIAVLSVLNLIILIAAKTRNSRLVRRILIGILTAVVLWIALTRFLDSALSFDGWGAYTYAAGLAISLTLWGFSLVLPFLTHGVGAAEVPADAKPSLTQSLITWAVIVGISALALESRSLIGGEDWNGFVESTFALIFWIVISLCIYRLRPRHANYSAAVVLGTLLVGVFTYKGLQVTEIFWAKSLGSTDDEISRQLEDYAARDASFQLAHHVLGNGRDQKCGDLCRILREYTNIRENHVSGSVQLVGNLTPAPGEHPNIFLFVIDSMRPDYLGAYNPQHANYTPNLDALARDSVVFRNVYTQYAGTSLSEPAIWSGALLLHTHFPQPFAKVNSLEMLARADGYQRIVSYDSVLRQLFPAADDLVKLDQDKSLWNEYEVCSTVKQLESALDTRSDKSRPVLFYAQPMNVHQFAHNHVPFATSQHWQSPAGLNPRITYEVHWVDTCLGQFFSYLKQRGMYEQSIIVIASDHGDATGEFGRTSHSTSIWPEIMHVPLIIHVPAKIREHLLYEENRLSTLTDIAPTLYYLLGHRPILENPLYGRPLFAESRQELDGYRHDDLFLASDVRAVYGILTADGHYLYVTYDSPAESYLFDLRQDPNAEHSILTAALKRHYDEEIIEHLHLIADYYGYRPGVGSLLASTRQ